MSSNKVLLEKSIFNAEDTKAITNESGFDEKALTQKLLEPYRVEFEKSGLKGKELDKALKDIEKKEVKKKVKQAYKEYQDQGDPTSRAIKMLEEGRSEFFPNYNSMGETLQRVLKTSIMENGIDTADNKFLNYAKQAQNTDINKMGNEGYEGLEILRQFLQSGVVYLPTNNLSNNNQLYWVFEPASFRSDDPTYKIKALAFMTSEKANNWGNPKTKPIKAMVNTAKKADLIRIINSWVTKDGKEQNPGLSGRRRTASTTGKAKGESGLEAAENNSQTLKEFSKLLKAQSDANDKDIKDLFSAYFEEGDTAKEVLNKILLGAKGKNVK